jgi:hypothetical protein
MEWQETENKARAVLRAAEQVQDYLINQKDWIHNFGFS